MWLSGAGWLVQYDGLYVNSDKLQLLGTQHTAEDHQSENAARSQPQPVMATIGCTER